MLKPGIICTRAKSLSSDDGVNKVNKVVIHPGFILQKEFLEPQKISCYRLSKSIGVYQARISQIVNGKRPITVDTALRLARFFNNEPDYWLKLQIEYDIYIKEKELQENLEQVISIDSVI